ncbi:hypothetical protein HYV87_04275 [Candidatus Woesearchaeota archaeon]|nr:hypothetical protein [Candidatus Woesearchaeota archaeon]
MDLDQIMVTVYTYQHKDDRKNAALGWYAGIVNRYGNDSAEERKLYDMIITIFPEIEEECEKIKSIKATFERGERR